jgi:hypothetical protein
MFEKGGEFAGEGCRCKKKGKGMTKEEEERGKKGVLKRTCEVEGRCESFGRGTRGDIADASCDARNKRLRPSFFFVFSLKTRKN